MDRYDPNEWTLQFARENTDFCLSVLQDTKSRIIELLKEGKYDAAVAGFDRMLNGATVLQNSGAADMKAYLAIHSFNLGVLISCALKNAPESKRRESALASFRDARDFSTEELRDKCESVIAMFNSGKSIDSIGSALCPNFPKDLIFLMNCDGGPGRNVINSSYQEKRRKRRKRLIIIFIVVSVLWALFAYMENSRLIPFSGNEYSNEQTTIETSVDTQTEPAKGQEYYVTSDNGLRLRKGPSKDAEILVLMPFRASIEVFEIKDGWAYVKYDGKTGYCMEEYIKEGAAPEETTESSAGYSLSGEWKSAQKRFNGQHSYINIDNITFDDDGGFLHHYYEYIPVDEESGWSIDMPPNWHIGDQGYPLFSGEYSAEPEDSNNNRVLRVVGCWDYSDEEVWELKLTWIDENTIILEGKLGYDSEQINCKFFRGFSGDDQELCEMLDIDLSDYQ